MSYIQNISIGIIRYIGGDGMPHDTERAMDDPVYALLLDLLDWIDAKPRPYGDVMDAWRTSCPRLPVWEEAVDLGLVRRVRREGAESVIDLTESGRALLQRTDPAKRATTLSPPCQTEP
jgi:D-3-phosphoglycerate dehydrogenase